MATAPEPWRPGAPARPDGGAKAKSSAIDGGALVARLRELAASSELPLDALEQSLRAVLDASGAAAGAICLYDTRQELLRLAAEHGMSDEGCRRLRTVRRGDANGWDMPLHGLLYRRAYLIDSAARNRYVPPLVEGATVRTIACLPLLQGNTAQGSLVLVMVAPGSLREDDIRALDQPMRELARLIDVVRRQVSGEAVTSREIVSAPAAPAARPVEASDGDQADSGRLAALTLALSAARRDKARLEAEVERLRGEGARQDPRLTELTAEVDRLRTRLAEAEAGAAHEHRAREELQAALQRGSSVDQNELREAIEAARRAETMRSGLLAENARLVAELERVRGGESPATDTAALSEEIDRLRASLAEAEAGAAHEHRVREELEAALQRGASLGQHELRDAHEAAQRAEAARSGLLIENARLLAELEGLRGAESGAAPAPPDVAAEIDRLRARLAEAEAGAAHEHRAREALEATLQRGSNSALRELQEAREAARQAQAAHAHVAADNARLEADLERARHESERVESLVVSLASAEQERSRLAAVLETSRADRADEQREFASREAARGAEAATATERLQAKLAEAEETLARERRAHEVQAQATGDAAAQDEQLRQARAQAAAAEAARDAAMLELTVARGSLSRAESMLSAAQGEATRTHEELNRLRAEELSLRGERDLIAHDVAELRARERELGSRLTEHVREIETLRQQQATEATRVEQIGVESDQLRESIAVLEMERGRLSAEVEGAAAARAGLEAALEELLDE
jgi:chromosome segregation ATPase